MVVSVRKGVLQDAAAIAQIQVDTWRSTYRGIVDEQFLSNMSQEQGERNWEAAFTDPKKTTTVFVAESDPNHVVGFVACGPVRDNKDFSGELFAIYVSQNMQGRGIGRRLVLSAAKDLTARSFDSMLVWVLAENPFKRFYESIAGEQFLTRDVVIAGKTLKELGYGWKNLISLISRLGSN